MCGRVNCGNRAKALFQEDPGGPDRGRWGRGFLFVVFKAQASNFMHSGKELVLVLHCCAAFCEVGRIIGLFQDFSRRRPSPLIV